MNFQLRKNKCDRRRSVTLIYWNLDFEIIMQSKSLLIAIAAFAVTATGAQAYVGTSQLQKAGFTTVQIEALLEARELKAQGEDKKARDKLLEAGVDEEKMKKLRLLSHHSHKKLHEVVLSGDYEAFKEMVRDTPLNDIITSKENFEQFKTALELKQQGEYKEARIVFDELGIKGRLGHEKHHRNHKGWLDLSLEQQDALMVARQSNDKETIKEILREAGLYS